MTLPDSSLSAISGELRSVEAFNAAVRSTGWSPEIRQLDLHARPVSYRAINAPGLTLLEVAFPNRVHQQGNGPDGQITFGIPSIPQGGLNIGGSPVDSETITCFREGLDSVTEPGFSAYTISVNEELLANSARRLQPGSNADFQAESRYVDSSTLSGMRKALSSAMKLANETKITERTRTALLDNFQAQLPALLCSQWAGAEIRGRNAGSGRRRDVIRRTVGSMSTEQMRQCQIEDLCEAGACSQRTLERSFRERFGVTPKQYLNRVRLAGVHRALADPEEERSIGDLAAHWGFWHLSQFAANYRSMYGELPSQTARSARH